MSEQKKQIILAVAFALILVLSLAGASYYLLPPEGIPPPSPVPTPRPAPTTTPSPLPTPTPPPMPTPVPTPEPRPTPLLPPIEVEVSSLEGFTYTEMGNASPEKVPVLHQGTSANITLAVFSHNEEGHNVSLSFNVAGEVKDMKGVKHEFHPLTLNLPPKGEATSTLILNAAADASNGLYLPTLGVYVEGFGEYETNLNFYILVYPTTPSYIFYIFAEETPTPTEPPPTNETTPPPFPTPIPTPMPIPTPIPTPIPWPQPSWEPEIQIKRGGEAQVIFYILTQVKNPSLKLSLTYQLGELPKEIDANIMPDPLKASQNSLTVRSLLLTLTANSQTPEETYEITANGSVNSITFERKFNLKVTG